MLSVIISTHNPDAGRLRRVLAGLQTQSLAADQWETVLVDNASSPPLDTAIPGGAAPPRLRVVREAQLGLTAARRRGFREARGEICVLVDDDNVLAPDYLAHAVRLFQAHPRLGALGGRSRPDFEFEPAAWMREFFPLLALRDPGDAPRIFSNPRPSGAGGGAYPAEAAPIGAGMAIRHEAASQWMDESPAPELSDRRGDALSSAGDNDIVFTVLRHGWDVAYFPELALTHLIPASRLTADYLARLNRGIQKSWMQVLSKHGANPWPPVARWTVPLRQGKAWFTHRAWTGPAERVRWQGACGHFEGRARCP